MRDAAKGKTEEGDPNASRGAGDRGEKGAAGDFPEAGIANQTLAAQTDKDNKVIYEQTSKTREPREFDRTVPPHGNTRTIEWKGRTRCVQARDGTEILASKPGPLGVTITDPDGKVVAKGGAEMLEEGLSNATNWSG